MFQKLFLSLHASSPTLLCPGKAILSFFKTSTPNHFSSARATLLVFFDGKMQQKVMLNTALVLDQLKVSVSYQWSF